MVEQACVGQIWQSNGVEGINKHGANSRNEGLTMTELNFHVTSNYVGMQQLIYNHQ
jgi:hypothetical protein